MTDAARRPGAEPDDGLADGPEVDQPGLRELRCAVAGRAEIKGRGWDG